MRLPRQRRERELLNAGYRFALALTHAESDAEDLVQTAFLRLLVRYGRVDTESLLYTAIRNLFYDELRRENVLSFEPVVAHEGTADPNERMERVDTNVDLDVLLAVLRPEEREALYLNVVAGFTAREIGEVTGQPRNTVLSLVHRARRKLIRAAATPTAREME